MAKYRSRPEFVVVFEAHRYPRLDDLAVLMSFKVWANRVGFWEAVESIVAGASNPQQSLRLYSRAGLVDVVPGEYIIKGPTGEFYPCAAETFERMYHQVEE
jgi:hypothetical protein